MARRVWRALLLSLLLVYSPATTSHASSDATTFGFPKGLHDFQFLALSADSGLAIGGYGSKAIYLIDFANRTLRTSSVTVDSDVYATALDGFAYWAPAGGGALWRYDPQSDHAVQLNVTITAYSSLAAGNGYVYLFGGGNSTNAWQDLMFRYNPANGDLTQLQTAIPGYCRGRSAQFLDVAAHPYVFLFGGLCGGDWPYYSNAILRFDTENLTFDSAGMLPQGLAGLVTTTMNDSIVLAAGYGNSELALYSPTSSRPILQYFPANGTLFQLVDPNDWTGGVYWHGHELGGRTKDQTQAQFEYTEFPTTVRLSLPNDLGTPSNMLVSNLSFGTWNTDGANGGGRASGSTLNANSWEQPVHSEYYYGITEPVDGIAQVTAPTALAVGPTDEVIIDVNVSHSQDWFGCGGWAFTIGNETIAGQLQPRQCGVDRVIVSWSPSSEIPAGTPVRITAIAPKQSHTSLDSQYLPDYNIQLNVSALKIIRHGPYDGAHSSTSEPGGSPGMPAPSTHPSSSTTEGPLLEPETGTHLTYAHPQSFHLALLGAHADTIRWGVDGVEQAFLPVAAGENGDISQWTWSAHRVGSHDVTASWVDGQGNARSITVRVVVDAPQCNDRVLPRSTTWLPLIVILHGFNGDATSLEALRNHILTDDKIKGLVVTIQYSPDPSKGVIDYAVDVQSQLMTQPGVSDGRPVVIVAHSMGGLVARSLKELGCFPAPITGGHIARRWGSNQLDDVIMLGTPNKGIRDAAAALASDTIGTDWKQALSDMEQDSDFISLLGDGVSESMHYLVIRGNGIPPGDGAVSMASMEIEGARETTYSVCHSDAICQDTYNTDAAVQDCVARELEQRYSCVLAPTEGSEAPGALLQSKRSAGPSAFFVIGSIGVAGILMRRRRM